MIRTPLRGSPGDRLGKALPAVLVVILFCCIAAAYAQEDGDACASDADCADGYVCDSADTETCIPACEFGSDCGEGEVCLVNGHCVRPADGPGTPCFFDSDCNGNELCSDETNLCVPACVEDADCGEGQTCQADGHCADIEQGACVRDDDCPEGEVCRDLQFCVPYECSVNDDCRLPSFYCREDGLCSPYLCTWDSDCLRHEFCLNRSCYANPATYVEGGAANCQGLRMATFWEQGAALLIGGLLLAWFRIRRRT